MTTEEIEEKLSKISPWPWFSLEGRAQPQRLDVYTGIKPDRNSEGPPIPRALTPGQHTQVCHFHPVAENWINHNENTKNDLDFICQAPEMIRFLLNKIKER